MKNQFSVIIGSTVAVASMAILSIAANGLVEISPDVGMFRWAGEAVAYALLNKLTQKLAASLLLGFAAYSISNIVSSTNKRSTYHS